MIRSAVSSRYAKALFSLLDTESVEPMRIGLQQLSLALSESTSLKHVMASPAFSIQEKLDVLCSVGEKVGCPTHIRGFLGQLVSKNRVDQVGGIAEAFGDLADSVKGTKQVTVTSASDLGQEEKQQIHQRLTQQIKGDVNVTYQTNSQLLSGLHIQIGSMVYDSSVKSRLDTMRVRLAKE